MPNHLKSITLHHEKYPTHEHYPFTLPIFQKTKQLTFNTPITLFVGDNGTGKSTLLEALANACGIHIWRTTGSSSYQVNLYKGMLFKSLELVWADGKVHGSYFGSQFFKDFANILDDWAATDPGQLEYFGGNSLVTQSHGQSLMSYFKSRYGIKGIYLLDEPETALSPRSQLELLKILDKNSQAGHAQFIIATHSPIILACAGATIYSFDQIPVCPVAYEETEHYKVYRDFMADYKKYI
jgi:predicted ATPase